MSTVTELAHAVMRSMGQDNARKQTILARSPHLAHGMDAEELATMSSRELAVLELKALGLEVMLGANDDPEAMLSMYHAGRTNPQFVARNGGNGILGGSEAMKGGDAAGRRLLGGAGTDYVEAAYDSAGDSFVARYIRGETAIPAVGSARDASEGSSFLEKYLAD